MILPTINPRTLEAGQEDHEFEASLTYTDSKALSHKNRISADVEAHALGGGDRKVTSSRSSSSMS